MINYIFAGLALGLVLSWTGPALASHPHACAKTATVESNLAMKYEEAVRVIGTAGRYTMNIFVALNGSWTVLFTSPNGFSCVMLSGADYEDVPWKPGQES